jgi:hypothetical protein
MSFARLALLPLLVSLAACEILCPTAPVTLDNRTTPEGILMVNAGAAFDGLIAADAANAEKLQKFVSGLKYDLKREKLMEMWQHYFPGSNLLSLVLSKSACDPCWPACDVPMDAIIDGLSRGVERALQ